MVPEGVKHDIIRIVPRLGAEVLWLRIVFLLPGYPTVPIGGFRIVYQYANYLAAHGDQVTVVHAEHLRQSTPKPTGRFSQVRSAWRWLLRLERWSFPPKQKWQPIDERVRMVFLRGEPLSRFVPDADVVFATAWATAEYVKDYPPSKGIPFYLIQHWEAWMGFAEESRVRETWMLPFHKVVISKWLHDHGIKIGASMMRHIPNAIDHNHFRVTNPMNARNPSVLALNHHAEWKGVGDLLKALHLLHQSHPEVPVTMFGGSARGPEIPDWVSYYQDPPGEQIVELYNSHSIYVAASWAEGWALPPAEAMACGCAFVGTDIGGFRDYAFDGETALLSPPKDPIALYNNLLKVVEDGQTRANLQANGCRYISTFTWAKSGAEMQRYIREVFAAAHEKGREDASIARVPN